MYCANCGSEVKPNQAVCLNCGVSLKKPSSDKGGFLFGLLGFLQPIIGLVLYLVWKDEKPKTAKALGIGALVSVITGIVFFILYIILIFVLISLSNDVESDLYVDTIVRLLF